MSGNNTIHFLSASDRINYGDLLFPLIFKKFVEVNNFNIQFQNYGVVKSDLTYFGALPTSSYKTLLKTLKGQEGKLVIGGGEVFFANWNTLYGFINPFYFKLNNYEDFRKLNIAKRLLSKNKVEVPFCPSLDEIGNSSLKLYFSSVGGGDFGNYDKKTQLRTEGTLKTASLVSVRDSRTKTALERRGITSILVPDSAIIMSDFFPKEVLKALSSIDFGDFRDKYLFLQVGKYKGPKHLEQFVSDVRKISLQLGLQVVLCPIGKASGHEDEHILKKMALLESNFVYINPTNLYDIMGLIANASLYLGTSLHGIITAQSFGVPFFGLNQKLVKVSSYLKTWVGETKECLDFTEMDQIEHLYSKWNSIEMDKRTQLQKQLVRENLKFIIKDA